MWQITQACISVDSCTLVCLELACSCQKKYEQAEPALPHSTASLLQAARCWPAEQLQHGKWWSLYGYCLAPCPISDRLLHLAGTHQTMLRVRCTSAADMQAAAAGFVPMLALNSALAFFVNLTNFLVTKTTSALTLQVLPFDSCLLPDQS